MKDFNKMSDKEKILYLLCSNHSGKMSGMVSVSTSVLENPHCQKRRACAGTICEKCYAGAQLQRYASQAKKLKLATEFFTSHVIDYDEIPLLNTLYFRFEAFGDLINSIQVVNYFNIARKNKAMNCALWTKNPWVVSYAMSEYGIEKPDNLVILISSPYINKKIDIDKIKSVYPFIDKVFTVYSNEYIDNNCMDINCGARECFTCLKCYSKINGNVYINERLK